MNISSLDSALYIIYFLQHNQLSTLIHTDIPLNYQKSLAISYPLLYALQSSKSNIQNAWWIPQLPLRSYWTQPWPTYVYQSSSAKDFLIRSINILGADFDPAVTKGTKKR